MPLLTYQLGCEHCRSKPYRRRLESPGLDHTTEGKQYCALTRGQKFFQNLEKICSFGVSHRLEFGVVADADIRVQVMRSEPQFNVQALISKNSLLIVEYRICELGVKC